MQRAAHGPGLHELAPLDRLLDPAAWEAVDPRPERQLGRARDLRVQAADVLDDGHGALARHALGEVLTTESPGEDGGPAEHRDEARRMAPLRRSPPCRLGTSVARQGRGLHGYPVWTGRPLRVRAPSHCPRVGPYDRRPREQRRPRARGRRQVGYRHHDQGHRAGPRGQRLTDPAGRAGGEGRGTAARRRGDPGRSRLGGRRRGTQPEAQPEPESGSEPERPAIGPVIIAQAPPPGTEEPSTSRRTPRRRWRWWTAAETGSRVATARSRAVGVAARPPSVIAVSSSPA